MTTDSISPPAQEAVGCSPSVAIDSKAVSETIGTIAAIRLLAVAAGRNQSVASLLREMTGLSKGRIAEGNFDALSESTKRRVEQHALNRLAALCSAPDSEPLEEVIAWRNSSPRTSSGAFGWWAGWIHEFEWSPAKLPISKAVALCADELMERLIADCKADDFIAFKQTWRNHLEYHGDAVRVGGEPAVMPVDRDQLDMLATISSWEEARTFSIKRLDALYFDLVATVDAEWGSQYFRGWKHLPMCPLVMVRPQDGLMETGLAASRRNVFFRPARRLIELLFALTFFKRYRRWPTKAPTPKDLAIKLDDPSKTEAKDAVTARVVSNHFDGTRKLTQDLTFEYWDRLQRYYFPNEAPRERLLPPIPVIVFALHWEEIMVPKEDQGKSFLHVDAEAYGAHWAHRRRQWLAKQEGGEVGHLQADQTKAEPLVWPAWMTT
jgi:hypothetical protein